MHGSNRLPASELSVLTDKLECLYSLLYLADRVIPSCEHTTQDFEILHHLNSIRAHLDAIRVILAQMETAPAAGNGEEAA